MKFKLRMMDPLETQLPKTMDMVRFLVYAIERWAFCRERYHMTKIKESTMETSDGYIVFKSRANSQHDVRATERRIVTSIVPRGDRSVASQTDRAGATDGPPAESGNKVLGRGASGDPRLGSSAGRGSDESSCGWQGVICRASLLCARTWAGSWPHRTAGDGCRSPHQTSSSPRARCRQTIGEWSRAGPAGRACDSAVQRSCRTPGRAERRLGRHRSV
jgi:hypothetical protein